MFLHIVRKYIPITYLKILMDLLKMLISYRLKRTLDEGVFNMVLLNNAANLFAQKSWKSGQMFSFITMQNCC